MVAMNVFTKGSLEDQRRAVIDDLGHVPEIPVDMMLKLLPDADVDVSATLNLLIDEGVWSESHWWSDFEARDPKDIAKGAKVSEGDVFRRLNAVQNKIVSNTRFKEGKQRSQTLSFEQFPNHAPMSDTLIRSRPDGCGILTKDQDIHTQKVPDAPTPQETPDWYDIVYVEEYDLRDDVVHVNDNIFKILWNLHFIMNVDHRRRFAYGVTIENRKTRIWFCCRQIVLVSEAFDFYEDAKTLIHLVASLAYASTTQLGYDPTMELRWRNGRFLYDITLPSSGENKTTTYAVHEIISDASHCIQSRATRIYEVEYSDVDKTSKGVLKDSWIDTSRSKEGDVLTELLEGATSEERDLFLTLRHHGVVRIDEQDESTENLILKGHKFVDPSNKKVNPVNVRMQRGFNKQGSPSSLTDQMNIDEPPPHIVHYYPLYHIPPAVSAKSESAPENSTVILPHHSPFFRLREPILHSPRIHYRIVFAEIGESMLSVANTNKLTPATVLRALLDVCRALEFMTRKGFIHCDVSAGNIILYKDRAKLSDLEFAKRYDAKSHIRTGTYNFMAVELVRGTYSFRPNIKFIYNPIHDLESLWWFGVWCFMLHYPVSETKELDEDQREHSEDMKIDGKTLFPTIYTDGLRARAREVFQPDLYIARTYGYDEPMQSLLNSMDLFRQCIAWAHERTQVHLPRPATYFTDALCVSDPRETSLFTDDGIPFSDLDPEDDNKRRPIFELVHEILESQYKECVILNQRLWPLWSLEQHSEWIRKRNDA